MMLAVAARKLAQELNETNQRMRFLLDSLSLPGGSAGLSARIASPEQMSALLSELLRAGQWLRSRPQESDAELEQEFSEYRKQVERLRALLPSIHSALLSERTRLEQERERVRAAAAWASASRQTL